MNPYTIVGHEFEHTYVRPLVEQKLDMRAILVIFYEDKYVKIICTTQRSIERWLGLSVSAECDTATTKQLSLVTDNSRWRKMKLHLWKVEIYNLLCL